MDLTALFEPDNLSQPQPAYSPTDPDQLAQVRALFDQHYPKTGPVQSLALYSGKNITSLNFRVETAAGTFALKCKPKCKPKASLQSSFSEFAQEVEQQRYFHSCKLPVPEILDSTSGPVALFEESVWLLSRFVPGGYFTGEGHEIESASETLAHFVLAAQKSGHAGLGFDSREKTDFLSELPALLKRSAAELRDIPSRDRVIGSLPGILQAHAQIQEHSSELSPEIAMHLDYHPLNVLVDQGQVAAVLDFEHFRTVPLPVGLGFAYFKLIRQAIVHSGDRAPSVSTRIDWTRQWLESWNKVLPKSLQVPKPYLLGLGAKYRILFLIHKILAEMLLAGQDRFAYDLGKQIRSLSEVAFLLPGPDGEYQKGSA